MSRCAPGVPYLHFPWRGLLCRGPRGPELREHELERGAPLQDARHGLHPRGRELVEGARVAVRVPALRQDLQVRRRV